MNDSTPIQPGSSAFPITVALGFFVAAGIFFNDYYGPASEHLAEGHFATEQALGLYAALLFAMASIVVLAFWPIRHHASDSGLWSVRGVVGWIQRLVPKEKMKRVDVDLFSRRQGHHIAKTYFVEVHHSEGKTRIASFGSRDEADALVETCSRRWDLEVER